VSARPPGLHDRGPYLCCHCDLPARFGQLGDDARPDLKFLMQGTHGFGFLLGTVATR
jgi:hypothetical protein